MNLDVLQCMARELNASLAGGHINKIHQPLAREIVFRVRVRGSGEARLMMSADPHLGRIHVTRLRIPNPPSPPRFCAYLRAHLQGWVIVEVACAADDRVVRISCVRGPSSQPQRRDFILELLGRDSNMLVVDPESGVIMECLHRLPAKETSTRVVLPGEVYDPPPKRDRAEAGALSNSPSPGITTTPRGKARLTCQADPASDRVYDSMNDAAEAFYAPRLSELLIEAFRRTISAPLKSKLRSVGRRAEKIEADLRRLDKLAQRQYEAELLKGNLHLYRKGMSRLRVVDWATGEERVLQLDPALDGVANMERIFRKAAKGKRGEEIAKRRLSEAQAERQAIDDLLYLVHQARDQEELEILAQEVEGLRARKPSTGPAKRRAAQPSGRPYREFRSATGAAILVGKSGRGNDELLRSRASKGDLWFHVKDRSGAHVLLRPAVGATASDTDRETAAAVAVHFSSARGVGKTEVMVAQVKDIIRPKGALPGQVRVRRYSTLMSDGSAAERVGLKTR